MTVAILIMLFMAVGAMTWLLIYRVLDRKLDERLDQIMDSAKQIKSIDRAERVSAIEAFLQPFVKWSMPTTGTQTSEVRITLSQAGYRSNSSIVIFYGCKSFFAMSLPLIYLIILAITGFGVTLLSGLTGAVVLGGAGYYLPDLLLHRLVRSRQRELFENFPDALDLLRICISAGLGLDSAIQRVGEQLRFKSRAMAEDFQLLNLELRAGLSKAQALRNLALRTGLKEVNALVAMLIQSEKFGTSVSESLRVHADSLRVQRRMRAQEQAAKIPVKLTVPMILCTFPALFVVLLGPAVLNIIRAFMSLPAFP